MDFHGRVDRDQITLELTMPSPPDAEPEASGPDSNASDAAKQRVDPEINKLLESLVGEEVGKIATSFFKMEDRPDLRARVLEQRSQVLEAVSSELDLWQRAKSAELAAEPVPLRGRLRVLLVVLQYVVALAAVTATLFAVTSLIRRFAAIDWLPAPVLFGRSHLPMVLVYILIALALFGVLGTLLTATEPDSQRDRRMAAMAHLERGLRREITSVTSAVANTLLEELKNGLVLSTQHAPQLVELDSSDTIESETVATCDEFIRTHETSAIGINGPRGAGKTTIMRYLCSRENQRDYIGVYVSSPVAYSPTDFVRRLHREVAKEVLAALRGSEVPNTPHRRSTTNVRLLASVILMSIGAVVIAAERVWAQPLFRPADVVGATLVGAGAVVYVLALRAAVNRRTARRRFGNHPLVALCQDELAKLTWSSKTQATSKNTFTLKAMLMEDEEKVELAEREKSHPERVMDFNDFTARLLQDSRETAARSLGHRGLIIALDELDKLATAEDALKVVNGIKDLLHASGTHFLVSVSEDALAAFALRGIPVRDAFDSSFDTIVSVARFKASDSERLLDRRVIGFPRILALYCHAVSGGLPRDLIRVARQCVDERRRAGTDLKTDDVVLELTRTQALSIVEAAMIGSPSQESGSREPLLALSWQLRRASRAEVFTALDQAVNALEPGPAAYLVPVLTLLSIAGRYFSIPRTNDSWLTDLETGTPQAMAEKLADSKADLAVDAKFALTELKALHASHGW